MVFTEKLREIQTPCYYYNIELLKKTLEKINTESGKYPAFHVHYAVKANANPVLLQIISSYGIGADCVSGNEIQRALECGFPADKIVYAGVGKSDAEIEIALQTISFVSTANLCRKSASSMKLPGECTRKPVSL